MVERNAKGREARRYFIECERQAKQATPSLPDFTNPAEAARAWAAEVEKNAEQRKTLIEQGERLLKAEPKAAALDFPICRNPVLATIRRMMAKLAIYR